ncbi:MAG: septal ring lytic transglycosylase RlpA family protein [Chloroflexota bacterium]
MRRLRVVAGLVLIVSLAAVAVPGSVGSRGLSPNNAIDGNLFRGVEVSSSRGTEMTTPVLDPAYRSDGALDETSVLLEPQQQPVPTGRPGSAAIQPANKAGVVVVPTWRFDGNISWYGPGFYGNRTACGVALTESVIGVAHRSLPCGTKVTFKNPANGRVVTARVIDRGPYVAGRQWDLTGGLCKALGHCYTGSLYWKLP